MTCHLITKLNLSFFLVVTKEFKNDIKSTVQTLAWAIISRSVQSLVWICICIVLTKRRSTYVQGAINTYTIVQLGQGFEAQFMNRMASTALFKIKHKIVYS